MYSYSYTEKQDNYRNGSAPSDLNAGADYSAGMSPDESSLSPITSEMDKQNEQIAQAMHLLLAAKERVLTLSEQRVRLLSSNLPTRPSIIFVSSSVL
jgi:hypothetical protein